LASEEESMKKLCDLIEYYLDMVDVHIQMQFDDDLFMIIGTIVTLMIAFCYTAAYLWAFLIWFARIVFGG
jgi:hypothetical protein